MPNVQNSNENSGLGRSQGRKFISGLYQLLPIADLFSRNESSRTSRCKWSIRRFANSRTALSHLAGGARCAPACAPNLACRMVATETPRAFAKSSCAREAKSSSVAFRKSMYALRLTGCHLSIILHTERQGKPHEPRTADSPGPDHQCTGRGQFYPQHRADDRDAPRHDLPLAGRGWRWLRWPYE